MADSFGIKLGIEGEREFRQALREINQSFKVLGSEMKLVTSQFDKQDNSVQAVTARNKVLNREIDEQKDKISLLEKALKNSTESFGETDSRTKAWATQLNNAKAELNDMERELDKNNSTLEDAEKGFDAAGGEAGEFSKAVDKAGIELDGAGKEADGSLQHASSVASLGWASLCPSTVLQKQSPAWLQAGRLYGKRYFCIAHRAMQEDHLAEKRGFRFVPGGVVAPV